MSVSVPESGLPVIQASDVKQAKLNLKADAVIVGSGAGGAVMAYELAREGLDVIVLEAGPYVPSHQFTELFPKALEQLYQDHGTQTNKDGDMLVLQGKCVGGSTVVNGCVAFRTPDFILKDWQAKFGLTNLTEETLRPYFERVERNLSIHTNTEAEIAKHSQLVRTGAEKLGWEVKPFKRNINQCALTGKCLDGCKTERKQSMLVTYLPWAVAHGAKIHSDTHVTRVLEKDGRAVGVEAEVIDPDKGKVADMTVTADRVIVAAGAVQTPLLLLKSGIANSSGKVGKNFACHPSMYVTARYPEPVYAWRGALLGVYVDQFMHPDKGGFVLEAGGMGISVVSMISEPGTGKPYVDFMEDAKYYAGIVTLIHDHNIGEIRWEDGNKTIHYEVAQQDFPAMKEAIKACARVQFAAGATEVFMPTTDHRTIHSVDEIDEKVDALHDDPSVIRLVSYHPQGTCHMGADPANSVVNGEGESHDVKGLYVADASLLPTSIIVNPQVSVYSLATYIADRMLGRKERRITTG